MKPPSLYPANVPTGLTTFAVGKQGLALVPSAVKGVPCVLHAHVPFTAEKLSVRPGKAVKLKIAGAVPSLPSS